MRNAVAPKNCSPSPLLLGPVNRDAGFKTILVYCLEDLGHGFCQRAAITVTE